MPSFAPSVAGLLGICVAAGCVDAGLTPPEDAGPDAASSLGVELVAPPPGDIAPLNLAAVVVAAEDPDKEAALAGIAILGPDGVAVEADARWPAPDDPTDPLCVGRGEGTCIVLDIAEPLAAESTYSVSLPEAGLALLFR